MFKKIIEEITKALSLAFLIVVAMLVIQAADLDLGTNTKSEKTYNDGEYPVGKVWRNHINASKANSILRITGFDKNPDAETIIHISIWQLKIEETEDLDISSHPASDSATTSPEMSELSADTQKIQENWWLEYEKEEVRQLTMSISEFIEFLESESWVQE